MVTNIFLIILIVIAALLLMTIYLLKNKKDTIVDTEIEMEKFSIDAMLQFIKDETNKATGINPFNLGLSKEEFERQKRRTADLKDALKKCNTGDLNNKNYVKDFMFTLIDQKYGLDEQTIDYIIPFHQPNQMDTRTKFDTLLFIFEKEYKGNALDQLIQKYQLDREREIDGEMGNYCITAEDIEDVYFKENPILQYEDKLWIIVQRLFAHYKGFGVIDHIRDLNIDGISGGVSGLPKRLDNEDDEEMIINQMLAKSNSFNSVWFMYRGKTVHLDFLSFESENELRRITQNIYKHNYPGQLSESRPYMINEMADGSRIVAVRPKFAESWAFFVRKFTNSSMSIEQLLPHENNKFAIKLLEFLIRGQRISALTGAQGSGKTTLLVALIKYIHASLTLRIQETAFELNLRKRYPNRNILTFQETDTVSGQEGLDLQKKTDGAVNIVGEVATDEVAAWMIQSAQVASLFTLFTHHAKTAPNLVYALRNSLLKTGNFSNEKIAEQQVVNVLEFNIHLKLNYDGTRYIERVTEFIAVDTDSALENEIQSLSNVTIDNEKQAVISLAQAAIPYFKQGVQQRQFKERNILEFRNGQYVAVNPISSEKIEQMAAVMPEENREEFLTFINQYWGD